MRLPIVLASAMLAGLAAASVARADPPGEVTLSGPAPTPVTLSQPVDPARLQLARQLYEVSGGQEAVKQRLRTIFGGARAAMREAMGPQQAKLADEIQGDMEDELEALIPQMIDDSARAYARNLTEKELRDEIAWLTSESGASIRRKTPAILQEIVTDEIPLIASFGERMQTKVLDRACARRACTAHQRQVIAQAMARAFPRQPS
jgi:hypothetical protein